MIEYKEHSITPEGEGFRVRKGEFEMALCPNMPAAYEYIDALEMIARSIAKPLRDEPERYVTTSYVRQFLTPAEQRAADRAAHEKINAALDRCGIERFSFLNKPLPRVLCAWCKMVMAEGVEPVSHGICQICLARQLEEL